MNPAAVEGNENMRMAAFRRIRDQIHERLREFVAEQAHSFGAHEKLPRPAWQN